MKKTISMLLTLLLVMSYIGYAIAEEEPVVINWAFANYNAHNEYDLNGKVYAAINEKFNVKIVPFVTNFLQNSEQFNMMLASGKIPDVWIDYNWKNWYEQGLIRTLDEDTIGTYAPYIWYTAYPELDPTGFAMAKRETDDGNYIGIPNLAADSAAFFRMYRQDWLDALDMAAPETLDDFIAYVEAVATQDPDGDGINNTYAIAVTDQGNFGPADLRCAMGLIATDGYMLNADDEMVHSATTEEYKAYLALLAEWYAAGYIYPESVTLDYNTGKALFIESRLGSWYQNPYNHDKYYENSVEYGLLAHNPDVTFTRGNAIVGPNGEHGAQSFTTDTGWSYVFSANASDKVVTKVLQIIDYLSTYEGYLLQWGEEGIDYERVNGQVVSLHTLEEDYAIGQKCFDIVTDSTLMPYVAGEGDYADNLDFALTQAANLSPIIGISLEKSHEMGYGAGLGTIVGEYYWNVIMGVKDLDSTWDAYIAELEADGLRELEAEAQEIYEEMYK